MKDIIAKVESYGFECEAGPLENCQDWVEFKERAQAIVKVLEEVEVEARRHSSEIYAPCGCDFCQSVMELKETEK